MKTLLRFAGGALLVGISYAAYAWGRNRSAEALVRGPSHAVQQVRPWLAGLWEENRHRKPRTRSEDAVAVRSAHDRFEATRIAMEKAANSV